MYTKQQAVRVARKQVGILSTEFLDEFPELMTAEQFRECVSTLIADSWYLNNAPF